MNQESRIETRAQVVKGIEKQLFGPAGGRDEVLNELPIIRYLTGMLFPSSLEAGHLAVSDEPEPSAGGDSDERQDPAISGAYDTLPSSMGVSFFLVGGRDLSCFVEAARYELHSAPTELSEAWHRVELAGPDNAAKITVAVPPAGESATRVDQAFGGLVKLNVIFRPRPGGHLVTATMINGQQSNSASAYSQIDKILFQCRLRVVAEGGRIGEYPRLDRLSAHPEDAELEFMYRARKSYGIGHGCAAVWDSNSDEVKELTAEPLPKQEVRGLTNEIAMNPSAARALAIDWLANEETAASDILQSLRHFADEYGAWINRQDNTALKLTDPDVTIATNIVGRQREALRRMNASIDLLTQEASDGDVFKAFRLAQRVMLEQFRWSKRLQGRIFDKGDGLVHPPDSGAEGNAGLKWRPFQLAFLLITLESVANTESHDRQALDLLWFPTGGGKTEAYLALSAFEIILRRLKYGDAGGGTTVLMRYTLRLLTSQQFERCATLVSVMEVLRVSEPSLGLGDVPISLGLWVGGGTTPNSIDNDNDRKPGAKQLLEDKVLRDEWPENPFQLLACPYCGTRIVPRRRSNRSDYGLEIDQNGLRIYCPEERCVLHHEIPVVVVDDDIYQRPPTIVIGTIDKFARMVWDARSRALLGSTEVPTPNGPTTVLPPSLVIQDELHLITGPLGTIAGVYEAAIDTVIKRNGLNAKYIAATATIQRAKEQCRLLYAREAFVFPPPGLDATDSFFSREDKESPGRLYIGAMNSGAFGPLFMLVQASAASAHAVKELELSYDTQSLDKTAIDSYWTQVIFHNSRQELGKTTTLLRDDVAARLNSLEPVSDRRRKFENIEELSANLKSGSEVSGALERLKLEWPAESVIDVLACTNMISVGVDVARLGLMIMKGQPKSTAEYIQATSRVGRSASRPPAIVLTLFSGMRPRDRSHYETFQQYHQALYRAVEPSSVTPFAAPALDRTLHAAIVLAVRHSLHLETNDAAASFTKDSTETREVLELLLNRLSRACPPEDQDALETRFWELVNQWNDEAQKPYGKLRFEHARQLRGLLRHYGESFGNLRSIPWPTLNSMRHVDGETPLSTWSGGRR